jgi:hypothetical protein
MSFFLLLEYLYDFLLPWLGDIMNFVKWWLLFHASL